MADSLFTERLELRPGTAAALRAELQGHAALATALGVDVPASWPPELYDADAVRYCLDLMGDRTDGDPWGFYYFILRSDTCEGARLEGRRRLIGAGGFKGEPDARGEVEIGYSVVRKCQRQGYASEVVRAWVDFAFRDPRVDIVVGQTLLGLVPSIGVLEKAGFRFAGAGSDPYAPPAEQVVRYELARGAYATRQ